MSAEEHATAFVRALGFADDDEMSDTPRRLTEWLSAFAGVSEAPVVSLCASSSRSAVVMRGIAFHSLCAHHLLPFFGQAIVAYRPGGRVAGLGSLSRSVAHFARRPQLQERLAEQIAAHLFEALEPAGLVVHLTARQLCVELAQNIQPTVVTVAERGDVDEELRRLVHP